MGTALVILILSALAIYAGFLIHHTYTEKEAELQDAINRAARGELFLHSAPRAVEPDPAVFRHRRPSVGAWPFGGNAHQRRVYRRALNRVAENADHPVILYGRALNRVPS